MAKSLPRDADGWGDLVPDVGALAGPPPSSNTGVVNLSDGVARRRVQDKSDTYGWDWSATTHDGREEIVNDLLVALGTQYAVHGKGLQGWSQSVQGYDHGGYLLGTVYFGAARKDVHVLSTSAAADPGRRAVAGLDGARTARVDTRVDTLVPFTDLRALCEDAAGMKARITYMESHQGNEALGRTVYVGAPSSAVRVRVYEKWLQAPGEYVEGTNRVEVQLRPPSRAKEMVSGWSPAETFCASQLTRRLASELQTDVAHPGTLQKSRGTPDLERTMEWMCDQYGNAAHRWMDFSGGDVGRLVDRLLDVERDGVLA